MGKASRIKRQRRLHPATEEILSLRATKEEHVLSLMSDEEFFRSFGITKEQFRSYTRCLAEGMQAHDEGHVVDYSACAIALNKLVNFIKLE